MAHVNHGRFVWHDLMSKDPGADLAFLKDLVGWTTDDRFKDYPMLMAGEAGVGGIGALKAGEGQGSHWLGYVVVSDLDAALAAVESSGGQIRVPAFDIPDVGRSAVVADPNGAVFSPLEPATAEDMLPKGDWGPGRFCWWELVSKDPAAAQAFYGKVIGWGCHEVDMGGRPYWLWLKGDEAMNPGGLMKHPEDKDPAFWLFYVLVPDVDAATARVDGLGGKVLSAPTDVPGQGRMSVIATPSGAMLALFRSANG